MAVPFSDLQAIAPSAVIELFQLELNAAQHGVNETYYFHAGVSADDAADIVWDGQSYLAFPIEATEFEYTGTGSLPRPKLRISNINGTITGIILTLPNGLEGAKVTRIRTLARYIDGVNFPGGTNPLGTPDPTAEFPREIYYIDRKASENRDLIEFELAAAFDLVGVRAPKRQCVSNVCQWIYRGPECGYAGNAYFNFNDDPVATLGQDVCGKRLRSCELRFSQQRFSGSVTLSSNIITLQQPASFSTGDPVTGFGLPASTTVSSASGNLVTVSQNATASTAVTRTGTIQSNYTQIVLSSAAGIIPGMAVTGSYLPANTQVTVVAGNTVTLSSTVDITQFYSVLSSFTGVPQEPYNISVALDAAGSVGQIIASTTVRTIGFFTFIRTTGQVLPLSRAAVITDVRYRWVLTGIGGNTVQRKVYTLSQALDYSTIATFSVYQFNGIPSASYTFSATNNFYTFRSVTNLPYGSYPGVGSFFA